MTQVTLSAPCILWERFWLFVLSNIQVPAKFAFWALAATTNSKKAVVNPAIKNNLFITNPPLIVRDCSRKNATYLRIR
jgi:hypothetical protein